MTWLIRHLQALLGALGRMVRQPLATLLTVLVIALALALPAGLWVVVSNAAAATGGIAEAIEVTVYLKNDVALARAQQLADNARERTGVEQVTLTTAEQALAEFREFSGFGAALESLDGNPLPHVLNVRPARDAAGPLEVEALKRYFAAWPEVELVQVDTEWVQRLAAILELVRRALGIAALVVGVAVIAVIGNTIRLEIDSRRAEIEVIKLVGGSNAFVRRPFLYTGLFYGLAGALLAWLIVTAAVLALAGPVGALAGLYGSRFGLVGLSLREAGVLLAGGFGLGLIAAWIVAARNLARIEPRA
ncbi:MAG: permease-like cell division protein FtsX [Steroidobacteraceae bacterium]|nr:cell division protein FtsX [Nevskiaceae bacterium]MCP5339195.1 cell division protein FtsX [Nevskiaceae bacterium]MCP5359464.1 cell division protein FtsX [Nevskiaceae bacterium]MCP5466806.1 cell division protein FtsX [Nevskiaceae bacterium]MCP5470895.1 cell division protein FtsX [Nevskiaceae bacterium]